MAVLITGYSGFVGQALVESLQGSHKLNLVGRKKVLLDNSHFFSKQLSAHEDFSECFEGVTEVIHCAARAHIMQDTADDPLSEYRIVNVSATRNLAMQAAKVGVKRFIYLSSIKVNGEKTTVNPFCANDPPCFEDAYGQSKYEAEQVLWQIAEQTGMEVVVIRPPLVYGPGVKGNFAQLVRAISKGFPLPLGAVRNVRSMVALDNLLDLIIVCVNHPNAKNQTFLVSDDDDISTPELLRRLALALGKKTWLLPVPKWLMVFPLKLISKADALERLFGSLQVDISHTKSTLGWCPPVTMQQQLRKIAISEFNK